MEFLHLRCRKIALNSDISKDLSEVIHFSVVIFHVYKFLPRWDANWGMEFLEYPLIL